MYWTDPHPEGKSKQTCFYESVSEITFTELAVNAVEINNLIFEKGLDPYITHGCNIIDQSFTILQWSVRTDIKQSFNSFYYFFGEVVITIENNSFELDHIFIKSKHSNQIMGLPPTKYYCFQEFKEAVIEKLEEFINFVNDNKERTN